MTFLQGKERISTFQQTTSFTSMCLISCRISGAETLPRSPPPIDGIKPRGIVVEQAESHFQLFCWIANLVIVPGLIVMGIGCATQFVFKYLLGDWSVMQLTYFVAQIERARQHTNSYKASVCCHFYFFDLSSPFLGWKFNKRFKLKAATLIFCKLNSPFLSTLTR